MPLNGLDSEQENGMHLPARLSAFGRFVGVLTAAIAVALAVTNDWNTKPWMGLAYASMAVSVATTTWTRWTKSNIAPWIGLGFGALMVTALMLHFR